MDEKIFVIFLNGKVHRKDTAIRTYKTRERAIKEAKWFVERGYKAHVGEFTAINIEEVKEEHE
jgi:galactokinase